MASAPNISEFALAQEHSFPEEFSNYVNHVTFLLFENVCSLVDEFELTVSEGLLEHITSNLSDPTLQIWKPDLRWMISALTNPSVQKIAQALAVLALMATDKTKISWKIEFPEAVDLPALGSNQRNIRSLAFNEGVCRLHGYVNNGGRRLSIVSTEKDLDFVDRDFSSSSMIETDRQLRPLVASRNFTTESVQVTNDFGALATASKRRSFQTTLSDTKDDVLEISASYSNWVSNSIDLIVPVMGKREGSFSTETMPGIVWISSVQSSMSLAEMLVHEASHQRFYILDMITELYDPSDLHEYYSPLARRKRPINKILLAFHALSNMTLFLISCRNSVRENYRNFANERLEQYFDWLLVMENHLASAKSISNLGELFWQKTSQEISASR